ncbi:MAG: hypothetical protein PHQ28_05140 [Mycobacterium sp.]|nr:hypothetical protein [Mycobacterium sp.]
MSNFLLLLLALMTLAVSVWVGVKRTSAAGAPAVVALIMLLLGLGGPVWEWSKYGGGGSGVPPTVKAVAFGESEAVRAFLWASVGAGLSALLVPSLPPQQSPTRKVMLSRNVSVIVAIASAVTFVAFLIGNGPSFFRRDVYLESDGVLFLLNASSPLGIVFGMIVIALAARLEGDRALRLSLIATGILWFVGPACLGSRTACAGPILGSALIIYKEIRRRRIHLPLIATALTLLATAAFTFSAVNKARDFPHGLLNVPTLVEATAADMRNSTDSVLLPVKQLVASVYAAFPDAEESARYGVDSGVLLANANPLPGTSRSSDLERYWPYDWVPLSFTGEWYGAMGWFGQILVFGMIGWVSGLTVHNLQRSRDSLISFLPLGFVGLTTMLSIEYSSRLVWRVISLSVFLLIGSYLIRERRVRSVIPRTRDGLPWNALGKHGKSVTGAGSTLKLRPRAAETIGQRYGWPGQQFS